MVMPVLSKIYRHRMNHVDEASQMINEGHVTLKQYTPNTVYENL